LQNPHHFDLLLFERYSGTRKTLAEEAEAMKTAKTLFLFAVLILAGCAQSITTFGIRDYDGIPKATYTMYLYSGGISERLRAVFLKSPEAGVEVVPYSVQIITAAGTVENALTFMEKAGAYSRISFQGVTYQGKTIGYLLTFGTHSISGERLEVSFYERGGKVFFTAREYGRDY
jgi:hypothetical protein